jgi:hypothetical protein
MNNSKSFMYTINSTNRFNVFDESNDCTIQIGPISTNYKRWYVQCTNFIITASILSDDAPDYIHLVADDWALDGHSTGLLSNQIILGTLQTNINIGSMVSGNGAHFIVPYLDIAKLVRFRLYAPDMTPLADEITSFSEWTITLLITPID